MRACLGVAVLVVLAGCDGPSNDGPSGLDLSAMDRTADPCEDFYQYACGGWIDSHPLGDKGSFDATYFAPYYEALPRLQEIIEGDAAGKRAADDPHAELIGDYYQSCLDAPADTASRDKIGVMLAEIDAVTTLDDLARQVARQRGRGSYTFFLFDVSVDPGDATRYLPSLRPGGFELDDPFYYLDASQQDVLAKYKAHIGAMSALIGGTPIDAAAAIRVETALAQALESIDANADPASLYHPMKAADAAALAPTFPWQTFWDEAGFTDLDEVNVIAPDYLTALWTLFKNTPIEDLKAYARWQLLQDHASELDQAFIDEDFAFWSTFNGQPQPPPRWFTCFNRTLDTLGQAVARPFVARYFKASTAEETTAMIERARAAFADRIRAATWLDSSTRAEALAKLDAMVGKVGYPEKDLDYAGLDFGTGPGAFLDNQVGLWTFVHAQRLSQRDKPVDRSEWHISPTTVNAIYTPYFNDLTIPAAVLTSPFLVSDRIEAANFGALGALIGHEMSHGFDDNGRHFDGAGTLRDWWTPAVEGRFGKRAECIASQFDGYEALPGEHVDGYLTLGENIADLGGVNIAYDALFSGDAELDGGDGYDAEKVFFLSYAQIWCQNVRPELQSALLLTDPHAPGRFRVNGPLANLPAFREAFACSDTSRMARTPACELW